MLFRSNEDVFDKVILTEPDTDNHRDWGEWFNKGRYQAFKFSPYDETILLDTDYVVNSTTLLKLFEIDADFCCHDTTSFVLQPEIGQERLSGYSCKTLWATVIKFRKTNYCEQIFDCLKMVQHNFGFYSSIHGFDPTTYRNDFGLTVALRAVNGQVVPKENFIPWNLVHVGKQVTIYNDSENIFNTEFTVTLVLDVPVHPVASVIVTV